MLLLKSILSTLIWFKILNIFLKLIRHYWFCWIFCCRSFCHLPSTVRYILPNVCYVFSRPWCSRFYSAWWIVLADLPLVNAIHMFRNQLWKVDEDNVGLSQIHISVAEYHQEICHYCTWSQKNGLFFRACKECQLTNISQIVPFH